MDTIVIAIGSIFFLVFLIFISVFIGRHLRYGKDMKNAEDTYWGNFLSFVVGLLILGLILFLVKKF